MLGWILLACTTYECEPVLQADGTRSGFEACRKHGGELPHVNRVEAVECSGDPLSTIPPCTYPESGECSTDEECGDGEVCGAAQSGFAECGCWALCASDAECGADEACLCALERVPAGSSGSDIAPSDQCMPAQCRSDADCESGECGAVIGPCGWGIGGFYCRTKDDECRSNDECGNIGWCGPPDGGGKWTCSALGNCD